MSDERTIKPNAPADFTPQLGDYKTLQPFRYWCQKVLPLVYDDSLSYYELLCKVVDYLNKTMEDVETLNSDVTGLHSAYVKLQSYVNNYFSTLNVQEEINNKLDEMASNGELYNIIKKYTDPIVNAQNEKIDVLQSRMDTFASLPPGSTSGNAELIDIRVGYNGVTYPTAGDAVRTQVSELNEDLVYYDTGKLILHTTWRHGSLSTDGAETTNENRIISDYIRLKTGNYTMKVVSGYSYMVQYYNENKQQISGKWWIESNYTIDNPTAKYIRIAIKQTANDSLVDLSVGSNTVIWAISNIENNINKLRVDNEFTLNEIGIVPLATKVSDFKNPAVYSDGTTNPSQTAHRYTTDLIACDKYKKIRFKLSAFRDSSKHLNVLSFYNSSKVYLSGFAYSATGDLIIARDFDVPSEAKYVCGTWYDELVGEPYMLGVCEYSIGKSIRESIGFPDTNWNYISPNDLLSPIDSKETFASKVNTRFFIYAGICQCNPKSFYSINSSMTWEKIYEIINHNFRRKVCKSSCSYEWNCDAINNAFLEPVHRFQDAKINTTTNTDASIKLELPTGEPSALVSADNTLYLWLGFESLYESIDGIHYIKKGDVNRNGGPSIMHTSVNYSNGKYYAIGTSSDIDHLRAYESIDGLNWSYLGIILKVNEKYNSNNTITKFGNSFLWQEADGSWYLIYEMQDTHNEHRGYELCLATSTDPFTDHGETSPEGHRVIGKWTQYDNNPIIPWTTSSANDITNKTLWHDTGNPEIVRVNNEPYKFNGNYYLYYHGELSSRIHRAYSKDLKTWINEGVILDVRDAPTGDAISNGDHCIIEYKGRVYMFYSHNINGKVTQTDTRLLIDDRPMYELLKDMP